MSEAEHPRGLRSPQCGCDVLGRELGGRGRLGRPPSTAASVMRTGRRDGCHWVGRSERPSHGATPSARIAQLEVWPRPQGGVDPCPGDCVDSGRPNRDTSHSPSTIRTARILELPVRFSLKRGASVKGRPRRCAGWRPHGALDGILRGRWRLPHSRDRHKCKSQQVCGSMRSLPSYPSAGGHGFARSVNGLL